MTPQLIDTIRRLNSGRITLFVSCGDLMVYGTDITPVAIVYQPGEPHDGGVRYSDNLSHTIQRLLNEAHYKITVVEDRN